MDNITENMIDFNAVLLKEKIDIACQTECLSQKNFFNAHHLSMNVNSLYSYLYKGQMPQKYLIEFIKVLSLANNKDFFQHTKLIKGSTQTPFYKQNIMRESVPTADKECEKISKASSVEHKKDPIADLIHHMIELIQGGCFGEISFSVMGIKITLEKE